MNESFPPKPTKPKHYKVVYWVTEGIRVSSRNKRLIHRETKIRNCPELRTYYRRYSRIFKKVVRAAKRKANDEFINQSKCKSKASLKVIKNELGMSQNKNDCIAEILVEGQMINNPKCITTHFNNHYLAIREKLEIKSMPDRAIESCRKIVPQEQSIFRFREVGVKEVEKIISTLPNKRSTGWDEIPATIIKECKEYIAKPMSKIINQSLRTGEFPTNLKISIIRPIFKKGSKSLIENYRPVSLLPVFSKIFEK